MERFLDYFKPSFYGISLAVDKEAKTFEVDVTMRGYSLCDFVKLHAVDFDIKSVDLLSSPTYELDENGVIDACPVRTPCRYDYDGQVLTIYDIDPSCDIDFRIVAGHKLNENMQGVYLSTYEHNGKTETIVATQFESHYAREAFPCIDEPAAKACFSFVLSSSDPTDLILSNMPMVNMAAQMGLPRSAIDMDYGIHKQHRPTFFDTTPPMSTYLAAFVMGHFNARETETEYGLPIISYAPLNQPVSSVDFANEVAKKSIEFFEEHFGVEYPLPKLAQVALPDFEAGAMENWGLVTYRESMFLVDENATIDTKKCVALTVAHELSHQWFGNLVTMRWWDDLWLNESFASVVEYYAVDAIYPDFNIWEDFFTGDCLAALKRDAYSGVQSVHQEVENPAEIATLFDGAIVYAKGAHLMLMLIRLMGWDNFCKGAQRYFERYRYRNAIGDNLWKCLNKFADFNVKTLMHAFIDQPGYPVISSDDDFKTFSQQKFSLDSKLTDSDFPLPEVTEDMSGHYVLNLSDQQFDARLDQFKKMSLEEKLRLLIDRNFVSKANLASSASLVPLLEQFQGETSAAVWEIILWTINNLGIFFVPESAEEKEFKELIRQLSAAKLEKVGLQTREGDADNVVHLRSILLSLAIYADDTKHIEKLAGFYQKDYDLIDSEIRYEVFRAKARLNPEIITEYLENYQKSANPEIKAELLSASASACDKAALKKVFKLLEQPKIVKPQDQLRLFLSLFRNYRTQEESFTWLTGHWDYVKELVSDKALDAYPRYTANLIRTDAMFTQWKNFFLPMKKEPALMRAIEVGEREIAARLQLIAEHRDAVISAVSDQIK